MSLTYRDGSLPEVPPVSLYQLPPTTGGDVCPQVPLVQLLCVPLPCPCQQQHVLLVAAGTQLLLQSGCLDPKGSLFTDVRAVRINTLITDHKC